MPEMHLYVEGQLYHPTRSRWPECTQYNFRQGGHELLLFLDSPTPTEIDAAGTGVAEFAFLVEGSVIFLLHKFGDGLPWSDSPYSWWLVPPDQRTLPNPEPGDEERNLMSIVLIDAATGIIRRMRTMTLSPEFTAALNAAIRRQAKSAFTTAQHEKDIARAYRRYPETEAMVAAATARCKGGE